MPTFKQAWSFQLCISLSIYDLFLLPGIKGLTNYKKDSQISITLINTNEQSAALIFQNFE